MNSKLFAGRAALAVVLAMPLANVASAVNISASSSGYGLFVDVDAIAISLNVGPLPADASGAAPGPYNAIDSVLNVSVISSVPFVVSGEVGADVVNGAAASDVDGLPGVRTTSAAGGVVGADLDIVTLPLFSPGLTIAALDGTLSSTAQITGDYGSLVATGNTTIESLGLTLAGQMVDLSAYVGVNVAPNTSVNLAALGILNATLILNEQIIAPDQSSIVVNAFHLSANLLNLGGDVILGHSEVNVQARPPVVPEPVSAQLLAAALLPAAFVRRWCPRPLSASPVK